MRSALTPLSRKEPGSWSRSTRLLTTAQLEAEYGPMFSIRRQKHLRETRRLAYGKFPDGRIYYKREDIEAWVEAYTVKAFPPPGRRGGTAL